MTTPSYIWHGDRSWPTDKSSYIIWVYIHFHIYQVLHELREKKGEGWNKEKKQKVYKVQEKDQ